MPGLLEKMQLLERPEGNPVPRAKPSGQLEPDTPPPRAGGLASVASLSSDSKQAELDTKAQARTLVFGDYRLQEKSDGFYLASLREENPSLGKRSLKDYFPLDLSGILELSRILKPEALHPSDVLFLDTETTGLSRSMSTLPFLIGLCWIEGSLLRTELLFIQNPVGEEAALDHLSGVWSRFRYLVSYNGKAFDIPLIRNRMILHRRRGLKVGMHFDMLHIMRRLFVKGRLPSYRQQALEKELLGFVREDDLAGEEIPQIYFDYLRYCVDRGIGAILHHNHLDLRGLVLLFLEAIQIYQNRREAPEALRSGLARILLSLRRDEEAISLLSHAGQRLAGPAGACDTKKSQEKDASTERLHYRDALLLAQLYRRNRDYQKSISIFEKIKEYYGCPYACLSLAKLYEHRTGELKKALAETKNLINKIHKSGDLGFPFQKPKTNGILSLAELQHRQARLQRKLERKQIQKKKF